MPGAVGRPLGLDHVVDERLHLGRRELLRRHLARPLAEHRVADLAIGGRSLRSASPSDAHAPLVGHLERALVAGVGVADHARAGVAGEHPVELLGGELGAVGDADHPGVDRAADADAAAVVDADPASRREAVLTSALSSGQSAMASEPSSIASVSR